MRNRRRWRKSPPSVAARELDPDDFDDHAAHVFEREAADTDRDLDHDQHRRREAIDFDQRPRRHRAPRPEAGSAARVFDRDHHLHVEQPASSLD